MALPQCNRQGTGAAIAVFVACFNSAMAAESANLMVTGVVRPGVCDMSISNGGKIDYGQISTESLAKTGYTLLPASALSISISCSSPVKLGVKGISGRPGTVAGGRNESPAGALSPESVHVFDGINWAVHGLGMQNNTRLGGYGIRFNTGSIRLDGHAAASRGSTDNGMSWTLSLGSLTHHQKHQLISWSTDGSGIPTPFEQMTGVLQVQAYLNTREELDLTRAVRLDGLTTIELMYL